MKAADVVSPEQWEEDGQPRVPTPERLAVILEKVRALFAPEREAFLGAAAALAEWVVDAIKGEAR